MPDNYNVMLWNKLRRPDRQMLVEFICECGVGHPAYGSALWIAEGNITSERQVDTNLKKLGHVGISIPDLEEELSAQLVHGCCGQGCCRRDDFPGTPIESLKYSHKLVRTLLEQVKELEERCAMSSTPKSSTTRTWLRSLLSRLGLLRR